MTLLVPAPTATSPFWPIRTGKMDITIKNGTVINTVSCCLFIEGARACLIDHLTMIATGQCAFADAGGFFNRITNCMISGGNPNTLQGPNFSGKGYPAGAVYLLVSSDTLEKNLISGGWQVGTTVISSNFAGGGVPVSPSGNVIRNNVIWSFGFQAIGLSSLDSSSGNVFLGPTKQ
jgi:Right handed beta helix region